MANSSSRRHDGAGAWLAFRHHVVRDAALATVEPVQFHQLCDRAFDCLDKETTLCSSSEAQVLADFAENAAADGAQERRKLLLSRAFDLRVHAARLALANWEPQRSAEFFLAALRVAGDSKRNRLVAVKGLADVYEETGQLDLACKYSVEERCLAADAGDIDSEMQARSRIAVLRLDMGHVHDTVRELEAILEWSVKTSKTRAQATLCANLGHAHRVLNRSDTALSYLKKAERLFRQVSDIRGVARSLANQVSVHIRCGKHPEALEAIREAEALAEVLGDHRLGAYLHGQRGVVLSESGRASEALTEYDAAFRLLNLVGDKRAAAITLSNMANALYMGGRYEDALRRLDQAEPLALEASDSPLVLTTLVNRAEISRRLGDMSVARVSLAKAQQVCDATSDPDGKVSLLAGLGGLAMDDGDNSAALEYFSEGFAMAKERGDALAMGRTGEGVAEALLESGQLEKCIETALEAQAIVEGMGNVASVENLRLTAIIMRAEHRRGNSTDASFLAHDVLDIAARMETPLESLPEKYKADVALAHKLTANPASA